MTPPIVYPDVVEIVRAYLAAELPTFVATHPEAADAQVVVSEPDPFPDPPVVVRVRRAGGVDDGIVTDRPRVDLIVWHQHDSKAAALATLCRALLFGLPGAHAAGTVSRVTTFAGPASVWDEDRNLPRYLLTDEVSTRGVAL